MNKKAKYVIRLDDACSQMSEERWSSVENILNELDVKPIVAVVPDNRDPDLAVSSPDPEFWARVRSWQDNGWIIAMHGFRHEFHDVPKSNLILPFYDKSEFGGLPYELQAEKIRNSWKIFLDNGIVPTMWVAPAHSFDRTTIDALRSETTIRFISDGIALKEYNEDGFLWIPQQLWRVEKRRSGLWTVCFHPNSMDLASTNQLRDDLRELVECNQILSFQDLGRSYRERDFFDFFYSKYFWFKSRFLKYIFENFAYRYLKGLVR